MATSQPSAAQNPIGKLVLDSVEACRAKLLDLSLANRLLNFKPSERSRGHIRVIDEIPELLFDKLEQERVLSFVGIPEPDPLPDDEDTTSFRHALEEAKASDATYIDQRTQLGKHARRAELARIERALRDRLRAQFGMPARPAPRTIVDRARELGINPSYDLPEQNGGQNQRRHTDNRLQTLLYPEGLEAKLSGIREADRTLLQDAGINALYCAFGFLEWFETPTSQTPLYAPLLFYPVELERTLQGDQYRYTIQRRDDDIEPNVTLVEKLKRDFGVQLPAWSEDSTLSGYWAEATKALARVQPRWKVKRWIAVGLFTFAKLVMYKDLDPANWTGERDLASHPILRDLFAGRQEGGAEIHSQLYDIDALERARQAPLLVTDADSSQHSAMIDVMKGKSAVIQGPPGTGKSQTITNIIAAVLYAGKTVLFVAEKMAALSVVKNRLDHFGLGHFCLEVHSNRTRKIAVRDALASRLEYSGSRLAAADVERALSALDSVREGLLYYVEHSQHLFGDTGLRAFEILQGSAVRYDAGEKLPNPVRNAVIPDVKNIDARERKALGQTAAELEREARRTSAEWGSLGQHPWRGLRKFDLEFFQFDELFDKLQRWSTALSNLAQQVENACRDTDWPLAATLEEVDAFTSKSGTLPDTPSALVADVFPELAVDRNRKILSKAIELLDELAASQQKLASLTLSPSAVLKAGSAHLMKIREGLRTLGMGGNLAEIEALVSEREKTAVDLELAVQAATRLGRTIGSNQDLSIAAIKTYAETALVALSILPDDLQLRSDATCDSTNVVLYERGRREADTLRAAERRLHDTFDFSLLPDVRELKSAARELTSAGFFARIFGSDYRRARKLYRSIAKPEHLKVNRLTAAQHLVALTGYLHDLERHDNDPELAKAAGKHFRGVSTNWAGLHRVATWCRSVREKLDEGSPTRRQCRDFLLGGDAAAIGELQASTRAQEYPQLVEVISTFSGSDETPIAEHMTRARKTADLSASYLKVLRSVHLNPEPTTSRLQELIACVQRIEALSADLESPTISSICPGAANRVPQLEALRATAQFAEAVRLMELPEVVHQRLFEGVPSDAIAALRRHGSALSTARAEMISLMSASIELGGIDAELWVGSADWRTISISRLRERIERALEHRQLLQPYIDLGRLEQDAQDTPLASVMKAYVGTDREYQDLALAFDFGFFRSAAMQVLKEDPKLGKHAGATQEQLRKKFQSVDREVIALNRERVALECSWREVPAGVRIGRASELTEMALIQRQIGLQRRHVPLRDLFKRAGQAIQALKPCFMMSPMSVAQFLAQDGIKFDLVVMDEASQIRPEDALGAVLRAHQAVIVGDPMQLPPTSFFDRLNVDTALDDEEDEDVQLVAGQESILDIAASAYSPMRCLLWHYRSQHEKLIAFSNKQFYESRLIVFPAPHGEDDRFGVKFIAVGGRYAGHRNRMEAEAIVSAAEEFMALYPDRSLGIVAVNQPQAELISELMDELFAVNPAAEAYRARWSGHLEEFFVKNLENVQGDERDVMFISTVYGPDETGAFHQRFGPINSRHGHRRLNVLFTRAKQQVRVFTSMNPADIAPAADDRVGVVALKNYLHFAKDGALTFAGATGREFDSEFESWVANRLRQAGYEVVPQLGVAGYFVDLAIRNPDHRGTYLAGIECDGSTYHSARSARDRDRLRQEVLEKLGWTIYRIWSTDWFRNPGAEFQRLIKFLEAARTQLATG